MLDLQISSRELLLLNSALNLDPVTAALSWEKWSREIVLEKAPFPELRILPAVHAHLSSIAPELKLPQKLRGKARATFTRNRLLASGCLPALVALSSTFPVMLIKGAAFCAQFGAWSWRAMGDIDVQIPYAELARTGEILSDLGWSPKYGMTWASLQFRTPLRRNSWNVTKDRADLDIHWRFFDGSAEAPLEREVWSTSQRVEFSGQSFLIPGPESSLVASLRHGFQEGTRGDAFQTVIDTARWLPLCDGAKLCKMLGQTELFDAYRLVAETLAQCGWAANLPPNLVPPPVSNKKRRHRPSSIPPAQRVEARFLRRPQLYRLWERLGCMPKLERLLIRFDGPFSKPIAPAAISRDEYDLRDCAVIDEIAGPGWGWPEPEHTCFWSDRADNRLLIPLAEIADHLIFLRLAAHRHHSPNSAVDVFANGYFVDTFSLKRSEGSDYAIKIPKHLLSGRWVELAFRPQNYLGDLGLNENYALRRSLPASCVRIFNARRFPDIFEVLPPQSLSILNILSGEEPDTAKFHRMRGKIKHSPFRRDARLPPNFSPMFYVLRYDDLFAAEVDPYEHFIFCGKFEGRSGEPYRAIPSASKRLLRQVGKLVRRTLTVQLIARFRERYRRG